MTIDKIISRCEVVEGPLPTPCWLWQGAKDKDGYGRARIGSVIRRAHIITCMLTNKLPPSLMESDHLCRNRPCCNPDHIEFVTHRVNMERSDRLASGKINRAKTHCPSGHPYTMENTKLFRGSRRCRECERIYQYNRRAKLRAV